PLLARLRENEWVTTFDQPSPSGPARKYYRLSPSGQVQLAQFRTYWTPFAASVTDLLGEDRDHD
ncbi:MAG: PadR family transcriptional regulator, partial [Microbacterium sp.]|uniref:PadR family transcriptional regulator n=2 Tax=unclassified Microbacterium TaxID=2609290 RepID=UPI000DB6782B